MIDINYSSFKDWMTNQFSHNEMADMVNHGCACGFAGLIYYTETTKLYQQHKDDIWEILLEYAQSCGYSIAELISTLNSAKNIDNADQFENLLVWFAAESIADQITHGEYKEEEE